MNTLNSLILTNQYQDLEKTNKNGTFDYYIWNGKLDLQITDGYLTEIKLNVHQLC